MNNPSYLTARRDILHAVAELEPQTVLDVGCAAGAVGQALKKRRRVSVTGIEQNESTANDAKRVLDEVLVGDALSQLENLAALDRTFDLVICADILEHLEDPWSALELVRRLCSGHTVVSLPNVGHISVIANLLLRQHWPHRDRGIHDRTHLRFFGLADLPELFANAGFREIRRFANHRFFDEYRLINHAAFVCRSIPLVSTLTTYQVVALLQPIS